jgi:phosphohistidine phosphatase
MDLFVMRHGRALDAAAGEPDATRALSDEGRRRLRRAALGLGVLGIEFDLLVHSPLLRAVQTAELLYDRCRGESRVEAGLARAPDRALLQSLADWQQGGAERVALVGHEPWLGELVAWLVTGATNAAASFPLRKGSLVWLSGPPRPGAMALRAALTAGHLGRLGRR